MKKCIGIGGNLLFDEGGMFPGYARSYVNNDYVESVMAAGGIPIILPVNSNEEIVKEQLSKIDGLIISGGYDVNPLLFAEEPHHLLGMTLDERDAFDLLLIRQAVNMELPILGICRGLQIMNVADGGTLWQDCSLAEESYVKHAQGHTPSHVSHTIEINKDSVLYDIFGECTIVNSFHHMAVKDVASGYKVVAKAADGIIEAIEKESGSFALGVQWHPEMLHRRHSKMLELFSLLIEKS